MNTQFREIDAEEVKKHFWVFYSREGRFFEIILTCPPDSFGTDQPIGFAGIRPLDTGCELEAFIFKQYRNTLTKGIVLAVLDLPESLGFKRCWMQTSRKTVAKLLSAMRKYSIRPSGSRNGKYVFMREFQ